MIVRIWEGKTAMANAERYEKIIRERDIPDYRKTPGFIKLSFLKQAKKEECHFKLLTYWDNLEVVKNFTGPNMEIAVSYDEDRQFLIDFPGNVVHYTVFAE